LLWQRARDDPEGFWGEQAEALWDDPEGFWGEQAEALYWLRRWDKILAWNEPHARWFVGGRLNVSANGLDRHLAEGRKNAPAQQRGRRANQNTTKRRDAGPVC
jgi:acetyl-CoA synthetase